MFICWGLEPSHFLKFPRSRKDTNCTEHVQALSSKRYWCVQTKCLQKFQIAEESVASCRLPQSEFQDWIAIAKVSEAFSSYQNYVRIWTDSFLLKIQFPTCAEVVKRMPGFGPQYGSRSNVTQSKFSAKCRQSERSKAQWF